MRFETSVETTTDVRVTFDEGEHPEVTKSFTAKVLRLDSIRLHYVLRADGRVDERIYGVGRRVLKDGSLGGHDSLGQFGISVRDLPEVLRDAYEAARVRVEAR